MVYLLGGFGSKREIWSLIRQMIKSVLVQKNILEKKNFTAS